MLDQVQHAFFVLAAAWCGWLAARRRSVPLAAAACLALAALINYQPNYLLLVPPLALVTLARPADGGRRDRRSWLVTALVLLGGALGLGLMFHYNEIRFGTPFFFDLLDAAGQPPLFGDPLRGIAGQDLDDGTLRHEGMRGGARGAASPQHHHGAIAQVEMAAQGLECRDVESLRPHYAKTLWHWVERLEAQREAAIKCVGEKIFRVWRIYMAGSANSFERGWLSVHQVLAGKPLPDGTLPLPLSRDYIYAG